MRRGMPGSGVTERRRRNSLNRDRFHTNSASAIVPGRRQTGRLSAMLIDHFDPPGSIDDFAADQTLRTSWKSWLSRQFDVSVASFNGFLAANGGRTNQFDNPATHGRPG